MSARGGEGVSIPSLMKPHTASETQFQVPVPCREDWVRLQNDDHEVRGR